MQRCILDRLHIHRRDKVDNIYGFDLWEETMVLRENPRAQEAHSTQRDLWVINANLLLLALIINTQTTDWPNKC